MSSQRFNNPSQSQSPRIISQNGVRILCIADIRGALSSLNHLAQEHNVSHILHTGDFGFYDSSSLERMTDKTLRHVIQYSPLLHPNARNTVFSTHPSNDIANLRRSVASSEVPVISELQEFLDAKKTLNVPVYTVWGACEDVRVLEKFRSGEYKINNLSVIDEASSRLLNVGGLNIRLLGLGGAVVLHKLFDNGEGKSTIAGGQGTMWTTVLQIGELLYTAERTFSNSETRILMTHHSPGREGLLSQLAYTLKADFTLSAGLHFRYGSSYNEFSISPSPAHFSQKLTSSRSSFMSIYDVVKPELSNLLSASQQQLLDSVLAMVEAMPKDTIDIGGIVESSFKNTWHFNLPDAQFGTLVLDIKDGKIGQETKSQGFNFGFRKGNERGTKASLGSSHNDKNNTDSVPASATVNNAAHSATLHREEKKEPQTHDNPHKVTPPPAATSTSERSEKTEQRERKPQKAPTPPVQEPTVDQNKAAEKAAETALPPSSTPAPTNDVEEKKQHGLWVSSCETQQRANELFPTNSSVAIKKNSGGRNYAYVFFANADDLKSAYQTWNEKEEKDGLIVREMVDFKKAGPHGHSRGGGSDGRGSRGGSVSFGSGTRGRGGRGGRGRGGKPTGGEDGK